MTVSADPQTSSTPHLDALMQRWEVEENVNLVGEVAALVDDLKGLVHPGCDDCYDAQLLVKADELLGDIQARLDSLESRIGGER